ncbi:bifunctional aspartate kinase/homoserine dehydrogenase I [Ekhidna sp.]|uniref:bifunctional aspartate kinase/homoserine dehydrogenase I n=1 Tax=Ekhidna sp. TaxID=2608089 RepID=UPI003B514928
MKVLKFGGTSLGTAESIHEIKSIILSNPGKQVIVLSAIGKTTNELQKIAELSREGDTQYILLYEQLYEKHMKLCNELKISSYQEDVEAVFRQLRRILDGVFLLKELTPKSLDFILSTGELISSKIIASFIHGEGKAIHQIDAREVIKTADTFGGAPVNFELTNRLLREVLVDSKNQISILAGFIASTESGETTTLGRGGSDYTAAIVAAALNAETLEIWTDVDGLMTADPRIVRHARVIDSISYEEAIELSHFGAKVLYPPSLKPCFEEGIPIRIKNTFNRSSAGTLVTSGNGGDQLVRGITSLLNVSLITLSGTGLLSIPKFTKDFFAVLAQYHLGVEFITQSNAEHTLTIALTSDQAEVAHRVLNEAFDSYIKDEFIDPIEIERGLSTLALVGNNMKNQVGVSGKMFNVLGRNGVSIKAISQGSSERNISAIIKREDLNKSLNILHEAFFQYETKRINLFIIGVGNVGRAFISQLQSQFDTLKEEHRVSLKLTGIANSKKMVFDEQGISLSLWKERLMEGEAFDRELFRQKAVALNLRNSIFLDITASKSISDEYMEFFKKSISVITPNKIAATESFSNYQLLKQTARRFGSQFLIETNVCAGLPVLSTLSDLIRSGDHVHHIEAVLSGTLNFLFNEYDGKRKFVDVIKQAKAEGYTEPDPRLDLSCEDVKRKLLILIRESGYSFEMDEIDHKSFMPSACDQTSSVEEFYQIVENEEAHFKKLYDEVAAKGKRLKVVATYQDGKASVALKEIASDHPFFHLEGKDNIVLFYTDRYKEQPLVIKGAGAGAEVTASGIFADVLRLSLPET